MSELDEGQRELLKQRVKGRLAELGRSQRSVEDALDLSKGTVSRIFSGRKKLDDTLVASLAGELGMRVADLAAGTPFAPAAPETELPVTEEAPVEATVEEEAPRPAPRVVPDPEPEPSAEREPFTARDPEPEPESLRSLPVRILKKAVKTVLKLVLR